MTYFDNAIKVVLQHEGGYVNDPLDPGGATNFGIAQKYFKNKYSKLNLPNDVKDLTQTQAIIIYKEFYWSKFPYDSLLSEDIAIKLFDTAVNCGTVTMKNLFHNSLVAIQPILMYVSLLQDINLANNLIKNGKKEEIMNKFCQNESIYYEGLVKKNPKLKKFLKGWMNRAKYRGTKIG